MRKVIVSFVAGLLVAIGVNAAYAEVATLIGKQVDGQFPLIVNGEQSEVPAITIEGRSYIPLRAAGELFGARVSWIDGEIIMEKNQIERQSEATMTPEEYAELARIEQEEFDQEAKRKSEDQLQKSRLLGQIDTQIRQLQLTINVKKSEINEVSTKIKAIEEKIHENPLIREEAFGERIPYKESKQYESDLSKLKEYQDKIESIQAEITNLEAQLAELEQQKAELEEQQK